ncbi:MAG: rod shape-determining protein MreC, partial [Acidimicrobiales bacterium]
MALSRRSARPRYTLALLVLASVTVITLGYRAGGSGWLSGARNVAHDVFAPVQSAATSAFRPVANFFRGAAGYGSLQAENAKLRQENTKLKATAAQASIYQSQSAALHRQVALPFAPGIRKIVTGVISGAPSNFQDTVELDKGTAAGVKVGMPAVSGTGLVGRVVQASSSRSTVQLVTDPSSNTGVRFGSKGLVALATGQG